jgi:chromosome segregation ATPase
MEDDESEGKKEAFYLKDPKRVLTAFFEREGAELIYDVEDQQFGSYRCTIKLPIIDEYGRVIQAECEKKHCKRREVIQECIIEACRILDEHDVLREGTAASSINNPRVQQVKRQLLEENDFYEEDEDTFYDRTGDLEKKRLKRMEWSGHLTNEQTVETFDSLCLKLTELYKEQTDLDYKLEQGKLMEENAAKNASNNDKDIDEVDSYIKQLKQGEKVNMKLKWQWKKRLLEIQNEERQFAKLLKVCKPKEFNIQTWRQQIREEAKQILITKQQPPRRIPHPPPSKPIIEVKPPVQKEQMLPPPPPPPPSEPELPQLKLEQDAPALSKPVTARRKVPRLTKNSKDQYDDSEHYSEEKFAGWMPPENEQTGDGRTALNDKYGY